MNIQMTNDLVKEYFDWICSLVFDTKYFQHLSYTKLFAYLFNKEFTYILDMDENRAVNGINLRYRFGYANGYSPNFIKENLIDLYPCSVLEMMVALAKNIEEPIMDDPAYGDRTGQWFWNMVTNLGLGSMSDDKFNVDECEYIINRFLNRQYSPTGEGGLFTVNNPPEDLRNVEIWYQAMWYLNEFIAN